MNPHRATIAMFFLAKVASRCQNRAAGSRAGTNYKTKISAIQLLLVDGPIMRLRLTSSYRKTGLGPGVGGRVVPSPGIRVLRLPSGNAPAGHEAGTVNTVLFCRLASLFQPRPEQQFLLRT